MCEFDTIFNNLNNKIVMQNWYWIHCLATKDY